MKLFEIPVENLFRLRYCSIHSDITDGSKDPGRLMKTLLLHIPKFNNYYKPIGDFIWLTYMPVGLLAMADYASRQGADVEVVHAGVEWAENRGFDVADLVKNMPHIQAVGLTLHWHHQAFDVIEAAKRLKQIRKDLFIFVGGDTATFFHDQIISDYREIDGVLRGHGEIPFFTLTNTLEKKLPLSRVPNLTWRDNGVIVENPFTYVADESIVSDLNYTNYSLLRHADTYIKYMGLPFFFAKGFSMTRNAKMLTLGLPMFPVSVGRGCPFNCTWCGGSHVSQKEHINRLKGFIYRSHDSVIESVVQAQKAGYRLIQSALDPEPVTQEYFVELWQRMRREGIQTNWFFECNGLPSETFLAEFKKTFPGPDSLIALSPETGNEDLRLRHKGPGFTDQALMDKMDQLEKLGIVSEVFFTYGLPGENRALLEDTVRLQKILKKRCRYLRAIRTMAVEIEPGAPWQMDPERFGIVTDRKNFSDFVRAHSDQDHGSFDSFGYYIPDYFDRPLDPDYPYHDFAERLQAIKCRKFCFIHPNPGKGGNPLLGRFFCGVTSRLIKLKPRNLSRPY